MTLQTISRKMICLFLLICTPFCVYSENNSSTLDLDASAKEPIEYDLVNASFDKSSRKYKTLTYYLYVSEFIESFIEIPTSNVLPTSTTVSSKYLAGRAPLYNTKGDRVGICSASFLCMQNATGIFTDIANYISVDSGLIITWFTPTTLINLELDTILHSMVTECIVKSTTKVGVNPFYGMTFNMVVSSDNEKIYFILKKI